MSDESIGPLNVAQRRRAVKVRPAGSEPTYADWQATEDDWVYLRATRSVRAWKLVALACGIHPVRGIAKLLPPELEARYTRLRSTVRGSLTSNAGYSGLVCDPAAINAGSSANTKPVRLSDFVLFMDGIGEELDPRMRHIAISAKAASAEPSGAASNHALERSVELSRLQIDRKMRTEDVTRRLKSISKLLLAVAVHNESYKYAVSKLDRDGKTLPGEPSKVFAALSEAVADSGLGTMDGETVREALWFAIDMCGRDKVMEKLLPKKA